MTKTPFAKFASIAMIAALSLPLTANMANAQSSPKQIKQNKAWGAYSHTGASGKFCFVLSIPIEKLPETKNGSKVDHGDNFFTVSQRPGQQLRLESQFKAGYSLQENSKVAVDIDGNKFSMFTRSNSAWLEDPNREGALVAAMKAGSKMKIAAVSRRGTQTSYTYSLSGITASLNEIQNCN
ncbi:MAG: invasion associated locus B family protein [Nitratireductor sp.]